MRVGHYHFRFDDRMVTYCPRCGNADVHNDPDKILRNEQIVELRSNGKSLRSIAEKFSLSTQRVSMIIKEANHAE